MSRWMVRVLIAGLACCTCAASASAQTLVNPTRAEWTSPDHTLVVRYELAYYLSGVTQEPVTVVDVGKPSTCAPCSVALPPKPMVGVGLVARVRADGADGAVSPWSDPSNPFELRLIAPVAVIVRQ